MFRAALTSAWAVWPQVTQTNSAWVTRFSLATCPQDGQVRDVLAGFTAIMVRPALSALAARTARNTPQPASRMLRLRPDLAATLVPGCSTVPPADRVMLAIRRSS